MPATVAVLLMALLGAAAGASPATPLISGSDTRQHEPRGAWQWPLDPPPQVVRGFEPPPQPWAGGHRGVDLLGAEGAPVLAAGDGLVTFSGVVAGRGVVTVRHAGDWRTTYEPVSDRLPEGAAVRRGDPLGTLARPNSHCVPRTCLHWGALTGPRQYRDPLALIGLGHPVLLPLR